jgi:tyrosinase
MRALALTLTWLAARAVMARPAAAPCSVENAIVRKEWSTLALAERESYINGIKCLQSLPSRLPPGLVPGSTSYYSDFAAVHINMTQSIHISGIFLSWHRNFLSMMEKAMHTECGYPTSLGLPYWDWPEYTTLENSTIFDGGPHSLGGNGVFDPNAVSGEGSVVGAQVRGSGGGCVTTGPFANHTVTFGPFDFSLVFTGLPSNWSSPTPHCMTRDLNNWSLATFCNRTSVAGLLSAPTIGHFQDMLNSQKLGTDRGIHGGGHLAVGGTMFDFFASPQDPAFFLHHGQIDRLWSMWQAADPVVRRFQFEGTSTIFNAESTPQVSNSTVLTFGILGPDRLLEEMQDPMAGPYCYVYQ